MQLRMRLKSKTEPMVRFFILVYIIRIIGNSKTRGKGESCLFLLPVRFTLKQFLMFFVGMVFAIFVSKL